MEILLSNSLTKKKSLFTPLDARHVRMYACGPTVYDRPHLGNARAAVVYDILFRLLRHVYDKVTYVVNITDVDDKIVDAANARGIGIDALTAEVTEFYHQDIAALNCLRPTIEPKATQHIQQMIEVILRLLERGHAYVAYDHVLFDVASYSAYGELANRSVDEMIAGARVEVAAFKKNPADFVLWKPAKADEMHCSFDSPWGKGRPGWHIECSAMSLQHLGEDFDIHGGGVDLIFPHHENELAQSKCANPGSGFARYWVHNGFLTIDGEKMSKSLGNFKTVRDILNDGIDGSVIRYFYLSTHYKKPLDFTAKAIIDAQKSLEKFYHIVSAKQHEPAVSKEVLQFIADDMNTPGVLAHMHILASSASKGDEIAVRELSWALDFLGIKLVMEDDKQDIQDEKIIILAEERLQAKKMKEWRKADDLRNQIRQLGYKITDTEDSYKLEKCD